MRQIDLDADENEVMGKLTPLTLQVSPLSQARAAFFSNVKTFYVETAA